MSLPRLSIQRPVAVAMLYLAIVLLGAISFRRLPIDLLPDVAYPRLVIHTAEPGTAPSEVERFLSEPIEQVVSGVPGVEAVESTSREGLSLVTARFAWGTDMDFAALNVREKLDGLAGRLPELASRPTVLRLDPKSEPVMALSVAGDAPLPDLKELSEQVFRRRLEQIDGVARAAVTGGLEREIQVELDPERLEAFGLSYADVTAALAASNVSAPGGTILQGRYRYSLRTLGELQTVEQIRAIPLAGPSATPDSLRPVSGLSVGDVAQVTDGFRERESVARFNGDEAVGILVFKDAGANTVRVAEAVEETLGELREQYPEVQLEVATSQATFVSDAIDNVVWNLVQGAALAFLVLLLFIRDVRYPIAIGLAIPISVISAFALMDAFGVTLNLMSLGGLALGVGMLTDNSIVVLENTFRHRELGRDAEESARLGADEVSGAITSSTLTTIAVFGPIVYIEGVAGELFGALSLAVTFSLLASILVALTLLPALAARWGSAPAIPVTDGSGVVEEPRTAASGSAMSRVRGLGLVFDRAFASFAARYERALLWSLERRRAVLGASFLLLAVGIGLSLRLERRFLPVVDQGEFRARLVLPRGTPLERTEEEARRVETLFLSDSAVAAVFTSVGHREAVAGVDREESGIHTALLTVRLDPGESATRVAERLLPRFAYLPPGALSIESGEATAIGQLLGGGEADLAVRVRGDDLDAALLYAGQLEARLASRPDLVNVRVGTQLGQPEMRLEIDREKAASYGIEPARIAGAIQTYMYGAIATEFVDFDQKIPVVVRLPEADRHSLEVLETLRVDGVPLRELVRVSSSIGPTEIRREDQSRLVTVYADVGSGGLEEAIAGVSALLERTPPPAGLRVEVGGENEEMARSFRALVFAFALALLLVFMILAAEFESFVHPFIVLLSVPMGLVGAVLALWVTGSGLNTMSLIGIVILAGIVDNDAVVKVDFINQMRRQGLPLRDAILAAGHARLRPIVMTTVTTMLGVLPMAVAAGRGAELRAPLAIAIFGGLLSATALTLIVLPVLYEVIEEGRVRSPVFAAETPIDRRPGDLAPSGD
jgi:hydrophobic/amphiphilic exporter-1 (mainly G- bacteria), HAE1 family